MNLTLHKEKERFDSQIKSPVFAKKIPTGIEPLDRLLSRNPLEKEPSKQVQGGLEPSQFYIIGAAPSTGKSAITWQAAMNVAEQFNPQAEDPQGMPVLYVSFEMNKDMLITRGISRLSLELEDSLRRDEEGNLLLDENGKPIHSINTDMCLQFAQLRSEYPTFTDEQKERYDQLSDLFFESYGKNISILDEQTMLNLLVDEFGNRLPYNWGSVHNLIGQALWDIQTPLNKTDEFGNVLKQPVLVIIDYLQRIPRDGKDTAGYIAQISSDLQSLARQSNSPIIMISSLSREGYKPKDGVKPDATMSNLKESGDLEFDADIAIILQPKSNTEVEVKIDKNRNGKSHVKTVMNFRKNYGCFGAKANEKIEEYF